MRARGGEGSQSDESKGRRRESECTTESLRMTV